MATPVTNAASIKQRGSLLEKVDLERELGLTTAEVAALRRAEGKLAPRLLFMVGAFMVVNYVDRVNLSFASVALTHELGLTPAIYGLGASLFFVTYCTAQIPSQIAMSYIHRQNLWLAMLLVTWGAVAACMAAMRTIPQFYALRVLLGLFEAGALPGLWSYLAHFYCKERLAVPMSVMMGSLILAMAVGPLLAAGLLAMDGLGGLKGWQWLFLVEGLMAIACGLGWTLLPADIAAVRALAADERAAIEASFVHSHRPAKGGNQLKVLARALASPTIWALCLIKWSRDIVLYAITYWLPMVVKSIFGYASFGEAGGREPPTRGEAVRVVLYVAIPFAAAAAVQFVTAWHSQRVNERRFHVVGVWAFGAVALFVLPTALERGSLEAAFAVLCLATVGTFGAEGVVSSHYLALQGGEKGLGMGVINSVGALGGVVGPLLIGALKQSSGGYASSMYALGGFLLAAAVGLAALDPKWAQRWMLKGGDNGSGGEGGGGGGGGAGDIEAVALTRKKSSSAGAHGATAVTAATVGQQLDTSRQV